jgi:hypothetical protein
MYGVRSAVRSRFSRSDSESLDIVNKISRDSCTVIENYWSRDLALRIRDELADWHDGGAPFVLGKYDKDELVRIYHVERVLPELKKFRFDPFILKLANLYNGFPTFSGALVYQHDTVYGREKSHYHVDTFLRQFKVMMYLDDVDQGSGPFSYIPGSHKKRGMFIKKQLQGNANNKENVFEENELREVVKEERMVCAPAGSLLLMDVTCIHRGAPQTERSRSVLMNYLMPQNKDLYLNKALPPKWRAP